MKQFFSMVPALKDAAQNGDVKFLKEAVAVRPSKYFITQFGEEGNIFHLAAKNRKVEFLREAINIVPTDIVKQLLLQSYGEMKYNLLHLAAWKNWPDLAKVVREMHESVSWSPLQDENKDHVELPWLAITQGFARRTPLMEALNLQYMANDECMVEILLTDPEFVSCTIVYYDGNTPLSYALKYGLNLVAQNILMSPLPFTSIFSSENPVSPFYYASTCSENVIRLLFKRVGDRLDVVNDKGFTIVHQWAVEGEARPCKILLEGDDNVAEAKTKVFKEIIFMKDNSSDTPLHIAAGKKEFEVGRILIRGYQQQVSLGEEICQGKVVAECPPWKIKNNDGDTPLHSALSSKNEKVALEILSIDPTLCQILNNKSESPFFLAVRCGCARVVDEVMRIDEPRFKMLRRNDGTTVLHYLSALPEKTCQMLLNKYWWIVNLEDDERKTALDYAKRENVPWLVDLLTDPSRIQKEDFDWIEACKREESEAVLTFVDHCQNLQNLCREASDTPLHHIILPTFKDYRSFLKNLSIAEVKNYTDHDGATALHRALERKDIHFAKALLLDDEVQRTIKDDNGTTAMDLLAKLCEENEDWDKMCKLINVNPNLKTSFIHQGTNLDQMRNTLSVVAALLATITFAAGFTLPGGINSDTGEAVLAKRAAFLVFLLADVYAMCTSILVLFCLIWSMVMDSEPDVARLLVDRSMFILMQSLYATLLAFMTGIYTVIHHSSLWAAIVIFVMCSVIGIAVNKSILHMVISKLIPATSREKQYRTQANEEELEIIIAKDEEKTNELKKAVSIQPSEYFLTQAPKDEAGNIGGNILHLAIWNKQLEFIREARNILPAEIQKQLLFQVDVDFVCTPLHTAALMSQGNANYEFVVIVKEMFALLDVDYDEDGFVKPWLALTSHLMTPLHIALKDNKENEKCAMEILLMDRDYVSCTMVDSDGNTPLYYALKNGFNLVAETILMSPLSSNSIFSSKVGATPFDCAINCVHCANNCSDNVMRLLFKKCGEWMNKVDDKGFSILHQWAEKGVAEPCKLLLQGDDVAEARTKIFKEIIFMTENKASDTALHIAARKKESELGQVLIRGYQQQVSVGDEDENQGLVTVECPPWNIKNIHGNTPLHSALYKTSKHEELALEILSIDITSCKIRNNKGESPFFLAIRSGCARAVEEILRIEGPRFHMLRRNDGTTVVHSLSACPENIGKRLLEKYWWIINLRDDKGNTALDYAKQANALWLVNLLTNPFLIRKEDFDWIEACKREEIAAVFAFVDNCQDLQRLCREKNDTPLHHIKLPTYKDYLNFLKIPSIAELKNTIDHDGATPLHRALERKDMLLAKVLLLDDGVERTIADHNRRTAMDLLAKLCKENDEWEKMCKLIKVNPNLRTSYIHAGTNLEQIRNTLSVVAALLATITFAAGFTLPGGLDSDSGEALLAKKAAFLVFLLADVYAMCTSMLVLFCLIWSMVSEPDMARLLVDRSVYILMQSLYATLLAFMTGVYTVIAHRSLWAAILIFVMCSVIGISANRTILHNVIAKLVPTANREENQDQIRLLEEGSVDAPLTERNSSSVTE